MKLSKLNPASQSILVLFFLSPYIIFLLYFKPVLNINRTEFFWSFKNSLVQSGVATAISIFLGLWFALGLLQLSVKLRPWFHNLLLLPQVLPTLFSILIVFSLVSPFPMGSVGVIVIFVLINTGLAAFLLTHSIRENLGSLGLISEVYGISRVRFFFQILIPLIKKDVLVHFLTIFLFCLTSISVPLIAGGGLGTNLEVLIYEKIFIDQNWSAAWYLNLFQVVFVFLLSYLITKISFYKKRNFTENNYTKSKTGLFFLFIYLTIYIVGYFFAVRQSLVSLDFLKEYKNEVYLAFWNNLKLYMTTALLFLAFGVLWLKHYINHLKHVLVQHFFSPSTILVGFCLYLVFPQTAGFDFIKIPLAFSLLVFVTLFRSFMMNPLEALRSQILVAQVYGLNSYEILIKIIWPQIRGSLFLTLSLLFIWQFGDFAIMKVTGTQISTLGLMSESFISSYRLNVAYLLSFIILCSWLVFNFLLLILFKVLSIKFKFKESYVRD